MKFPHIASLEESQQIDKAFCKGVKHIENYCISYHPMDGYNQKKKTYKNPDGSHVLAWVGIRIYKYENGISFCIYSEDLK